MTRKQVIEALQKIIKQFEDSDWNDAGISTINLLAALEAEQSKKPKRVTEADTMKSFTHKRLGPDTIAPSRRPEPRTLLGSPVVTDTISF